MGAASTLSLSLPVPFLNTERTKGRQHACPLPILHDHIHRLFMFSFFFLYLPILSCQLPIYHLFSSDGKMLFSILFYAKICTYLTENILFLCCKIPFLFQNFCQIFRGKVLKSPYLDQIFCGWSPSHLSQLAKLVEFTICTRKNKSPFLVNFLYYKCC